MAKLVRNMPSHVFKLAVFRLLHAHVHGGACFNNEKVVTSARVVKNARELFRTLFYSDRVSRATMMAIIIIRSKRIAACSQEQGVQSELLGQSGHDTPLLPLLAHLQPADAAVWGG